VGHPARPVSGRVRGCGRSDVRREAVAMLKRTLIVSLAFITLGIVTFAWPLGDNA
jgi:hypothetical protein